MIIQRYDLSAMIETRWSGWLGLVALLLAFSGAGCASPPIRPNVTLDVGEVLLDAAFSRPFEWDNREQGGVRVGVEGDTYRIVADVSSYVRGYHAARHDDVVIDVGVTQLSTGAVNAYGVVCRGSSDPTSANGYYFLISGDGAFSIRRGRQGDLQPIVHWSRSTVINRGGFNRLRVVCVEDYLALWVNGELVAQARDDVYRAGRVGFAATARDGDVIDVVFANLIISAGSITPR